MSKIIEGSTIPYPKQITAAAEAEFKAWDYGKKMEGDGQELIEKYVKVTPGISSDGSDPWSAVFISYLMKKGDADFPNSASHHGYAESALYGVKGYELFALDAGLVIRAEVGDILIYPRRSESNPTTASHGNVIYRVDKGIAHLIGGNLGKEYQGTVKVSEIKLSNDYYIDDTTKTGEYKLLVKKTNNKYYQGINLKSKLINLDVNSELFVRKTIPSSEKQRNINEVFNFFKSRGFSKHVVAGIMGNIEHESHFNPNALNGKDTNSRKSYGLVQYNEGSYKLIPYDKGGVGVTIQEQLTYLLNTPNFKKFMDFTNSDPDTTPYKAAFSFARLFEICVGCKTIDTYRNNKEFKPYTRSKYAETFYEMFQIRGNDLYWP